jgi:hypothetical protein
MLNRANTACTSLGYKVLPEIHTHYWVLLHRNVYLSHHYGVTSISPDLVIPMLIWMGAPLLTC